MAADDEAESTISWAELLGRGGRPSSGSKTTTADAAATDDETETTISWADLLEGGGGRRGPTTRRSSPSSASVSEITNDAAIDDEREATAAAARSERRRRERGRWRDRLEGYADDGLARAASKRSEGLRALAACTGGGVEDAASGSQLLGSFADSVAVAGRAASSALREGAANATKLVEKVSRSAEERERAKEERMLRLEEERRARREERMKEEMRRSRGEVGSAVAHLWREK